MVSYLPLAGPLYPGMLPAPAVALQPGLTGGVPSDAMIRAVEEWAVPGLTGPAPANPLFHGLPWMVPGPTSGVPYYAR